MYPVAEVLEELRFESSTLQVRRPLPLWKGVPFRRVRRRGKGWCYASSIFGNDGPEHSDDSWCLCKDTLFLGSIRAGTFKESLKHQTLTSRQPEDLTRG